MKTIEEFNASKDETPIEIEFTVEDMTFIFDGEEIMEQKPRLGRVTKKQREANTVKSEVMKEITDPNGSLAPLINKLFKAITMVAKKKASAAGVPKMRINLDKITLRRPIKKS